MAKTNDVAELQAKIAATRAAMSQNIEGLITEVHPAAVKARTVNDAKLFVSSTVEDAKGAIVDDAGPRWDRIGTAIIVTVSVLATIVVLSQVGKGIRGIRGRKAHE